MNSSELVIFAKSKGITTLALTDHDTTAGLEEAQKTAVKEGINFIPGIEINIQWPTGEFHLLGLGLKTTGPKLASLIENLNISKENRNIQIVQKLNEAGVNVSYQEILNRFPDTNIGRPHIATILMEKGIVKQRQLAFDRYFAKGKPCYVPQTGADLVQAVEAIKESGGIPVQAHPMSMYVSWGKMDDTMIGIQGTGVMGLEAWHPGVRLAEAQRLEELARKLDMIVTAGSDFHGQKVRADRHIGYTAGKKKIEDRFWNSELGPLLEKVHGGKDHTYRI